MNAFTNYLEKLGNNFLVSSMIPSLAFVIASILMFDPILRVMETFKESEGTGQFIEFGMIVFIVTVIIGYTLTVMNTHILKIFEGYIKFPLLQFIYNKTSRAHQQKAMHLMARRERLKQEINYLKKSPNRNNELELKIESLLGRYHKVASEYDTQYPADLRDVLPTSFGNLLRAAEDHAVQRYGFDGVTFWPRLVHVIPDSYKATIDNSRNELSFLVNMSILSATFSALCILAISHVMWNTTVAAESQMIFALFIQDVLRYLIAAMIGMICFVFFYKASIISLSAFTLTIRSSFDLFRLDLLKKLEMARPNNFGEEVDTWNNLNELILLGNESLSFQPFNFCPDASSPAKK
jgi:hypothetical protein